MDTGTTLLEIKEQLGRVEGILEEKCKLEQEQREFLKGLYAAINGNGHMGLKTKVKILWWACSGAWAAILVYVGSLVRADILAK